MDGQDKTATTLGRVAILREAATSFVINGVLSIAFFAGVFGLSGGALNWGAPDDLAWDFLPQSIAVALMSALVPVLVLRAKLVRSGAMVVPSVGRIVKGAVGFALAGAVLGSVLATVLITAQFSAVLHGAALAMKIIYGGTLGAVITILAIRRAMR